VELRHGGRHIFGSGPCSRFHSTKNRIQNSDPFSHALPSLSLSLSLSLSAGAGAPSLQQCKTVFGYRDPWCCLHYQSDAGLSVAQLYGNYHRLLFGLSSGERGETKLCDGVPSMWLGVVGYSPMKLSPYVHMYVLFFCLFILACSLSRLWRRTL